jgi:hypothetical protein
MGHSSISAREVAPVAIFYMNVQIIGRSAGRSATGAAAYRAGERIVDERTGRTYDYTRRQGEIETEIIAPEGSPSWVHDRERLWNAVELAEKRSDAQVAREMVVALPKELTNDQQWELVRNYVKEQFVSHGMVADVAIHRNPGNPHAHIMLTMREMTPEGLASKKNRDWNRPEMLEKWRENWATASNRVLERAGHDDRIDHRSLETQGQERLPQVHLGPRAAAMERQGVASAAGEHNRLVEQHNCVVIDLEKARAERQALEVEKTVSDRFDARIREGWHQPHASALADLEYEAGGRTITRDELLEERSHLSQEHHKVTTKIREIRDEGMRLERAGVAVKEHLKAVDELKRHQGPIASIRRLLKPEARSDYKHALDRVGYAQSYMKEQNVTSPADLVKQRSTWQEKSTQVPKLEVKAKGINDRMNTLNLARSGLDLALERLQRALQRKRQPERNPVQEQERQRSRDRGR